MAFEVKIAKVFNCFSFPLVEGGGWGWGGGCQDQSVNYKVGALKVRRI